MRPPTAPLAAAARPHLILRPERARLRYAHRLRSLQYRAQRCTRARPADSARARSRLAAFAHEVGSSAARARKYILGVWRYGCGDLICSELSLAPARRAPPLIDSAQMNAVARCRLPAPASHSLLPNVRLTAAKHRRHGRQHRHHRRASRRRLHRRRRLFFATSDAWREHPVAAAGRCHAAWSEGGDQRGPDGAPERRPSMGGLACSQARLGRRLRRFAARSMAHRRCHGYGKKMRV